MQEYDGERSCPGSTTAISSVIIFVNFILDSEQLDR